MEPIVFRFMVRRGSILTSSHQRADRDAWGGGTGGRWDAGNLGVSSLQVRTVTPWTHGSTFLLCIFILGENDQVGYISIQFSSNSRSFLGQHKCSWDVFSPFLPTPVSCPASSYKISPAIRELLFYLSGMPTQGCKHRISPTFESNQRGPRERLWSREVVIGLNQVWE